MGMHADWVAAKKAAKKTFEASLSKADQASYATGNLDYPLDEVFNKKLGPNLDKYEKEKNSQKKADLVDKIHGAIKYYMEQVKKNKGNLGSKGSAIASSLIQELNTIKDNVT